MTKATNYVFTMDGFNMKTLETPKHIPKPTFTQKITKIFKKNEKTEKVIEPVAEKKWNMKFNGKMLGSYQTDALKWMLKREISRFAPGGFLCLDMGLGKTALTIAAVCVNELEHTLIVVPKSLVGQWVTEFEKFTGYTPLIADKKTTYDEIHEHPVVITTYPTIGTMDESNKADVAVFNYEFDRLVLDEAHFVKNKKSKTHRLIKDVKSTVRWCLTGTPINRDEKDFTALLEFMGIFNVNLREAANTYMYRKTKEDVNVKIETLEIETVESDFETFEEKDLYEELVEHGKMLMKAYSAYGDNEGRMNLLKQLLRLRQCVTNPKLLYVNSETDEEWKGNCTKLNMMKREIKNNPMEKTLIFCHFIYEMDAVQHMLSGIGMKSVRIDGSKSKEERDEALTKFSTDDTINFFVIQIMAGGVGLNIQTATRVFINSLHWNATAELQAISRAHRIGQTNRVVVKRFIIRDTIDNHIMNLQQKKLDIAADILGDTRIKSQLASKQNFNRLMAIFK